MAVLALLDRVNRRHPWSHNDRLGGWTGRRVAEVGARDVLDVGCGTGNLVERLRRHARVVGLEPDPTTAAVAARRFDHDPAVGIEAVGFAKRDRDRRWDAITMVAVLHHLPLAPTLRELRLALRPGGRLVIVGCHRDNGPTDRVLALVSILANPVVGMTKHPSRAHGLPEHLRAPTAPPVHDLAEITAVVRQELPGARIRRRLFWRHTVVYDVPSADH